MTLTNCDPKDRPGSSVDNLKGVQDEKSLRIETLENLRTRLLSHPVHGNQPGVLLFTPYDRSKEKRFETLETFQ